MLAGPDHRTELIMDTTAQPPRILDPWTTSARDPTRDADALRRSQANILRWMEYLPEDCIKKMIEMGWDFST
jgi:hypothetical protein